MKSGNDSLSRTPAKGLAVATFIGASLSHRDKDENEQQPGFPASAKRFLLKQGRIPDQVRGSENSSKNYLKSPKGRR